MKTIKYVVLLASLLIATSAFAQAATRNVNVSWNVSTQTGVTGYNLYRATTSGGPYTKLNTTQIPVATNQFQDTATVGTTYFYTITAIAPACTNSTPVTTPCGESLFSPEVTVPVPPKPTSSTTIIVSVP